MIDAPILAFITVLSSHLYGHIYESFITERQLGIFLCIKNIYDEQETNYLMLHARMMITHGHNHPGYELRGGNDIVTAYKIQ